MSNMSKDIPYIEKLPNDWKMIQNRYLFKETKDKVGKEFENYQLLSLTTKGIRKKDINAAGGKVPDSYENYQKVKKGQMVFCLFDLDCSAVFSGFSSLNGMITSAYNVYDSKKLLTNEFANYWFQYVFSNRYYKMYSKSIRYTITGDMFKSIKTPVPPMRKQVLISNFLDKKCSQIDRLISNQEKQIDNLKAYKQSLITETVTKGLNTNVEMKDSNVEWVGDVPEHWNIIQLKYCTYIRARLGWKGLKAEEYEETGYPLLSAFNIQNNKLDFDNVNYINKFRYDESPEIKLSNNDILLVKDGAGIGKCGIVEKLPMESTTNGSLAVITVIKDLLPKYLYYYFLSAYFQQYIDRIKDGMGVPHLFQSDLKEIRVIAPSEAEQTEMVNFLDVNSTKIDELIKIKEQKIEKLNEYKKSLIYEYVTGKKEVI